MEPSNSISRRLYLYINQILPSPYFFGLFLTHLVLGVTCNILTDGLRKKLLSYAIVKGYNNLVKGYLIWSPHPSLELPGTTMLHLAAQQGNYEIFNDLVLYGDNRDRAFFARDSDGNIPLHMLVLNPDHHYEGKLRIALSLCSDCYFFPNSMTVVNNQQKTPLMTLLDNLLSGIHEDQDNRLLDAIIQLSPDTMTSYAELGFTALHFLCARAIVSERCERLLEHADRLYRPELINLNVRTNHLFLPTDRTAAEILLSSQSHPIECLYLVNSWILRRAIDCNRILGNLIVFYSLHPEIHEPCRAVVQNLLDQTINFNYITTPVLAVPFRQQTLAPEGLTIFEWALFFSDDLTRLFLSAHEVYMTDGRDGIIFRDINRCQEIANRPLPTDIFLAIEGWYLSQLPIPLQAPNPPVAADWTHTESSMRALIPAEERTVTSLSVWYPLTVTPPISSPLNTHWNGYDRYFHEMRDALARLYNADPIKVRSITGVEHALPLTYDDFRDLIRPCNLDMNSCLRAYYRNNIHTAYRFFLKPNPWMNPQASFALNSAVDYPESYPLISRLWLAVQDSGRFIETGKAKNVEERRMYFLMNFEQFVRAHNRDHNRDDNLSDSPSCRGGVNKRLLAGFVSHPCIAQDLTNELALAYYKEAVRTYLTQKIEALIDYERFSITYEEWKEDPCEDPALDALVGFNASDKDRFNRSMVDTFGDQWTRSSFKQSILREFDKSVLNQSSEYYHSQLELLMSQPRLSSTMRL